MPAERRLSDFRGLWVIARTITQADGTTGQFSGTGDFAPTADGALEYTETGELRLANSPPMRATRRYRWEEGLNVFFEDGRAFHRIPGAGGEALHLCPPDTYRVADDFSDWPNWRATWDVTGPKKAYRMVSQYSPAA